MSSRRGFARFAVSAALVGSVLACGDARNPNGPAGDGGGDGGVLGGGDGGPITPPDAGPPPATAERLELIPPQAELVSVDGARVTQTFRGEVVYSDGTRTPASARFAVDPLALGEITPVTGVLTANGRIGGAGKVLAEVVARGRTLRAEAPVRVRIVRRLFPVGTSSVTIAAQFDPAPTADPARAATIVYPLAGAVMPENVYPPDIQWTTSAPGDLLRVVLEKPSARMVAYVRAEAGYGNHWQPSPADWGVVTNTDPGLPLDISVTRLEAASGQLVSEPPVRVELARAALSGSIYYWDIAAGRIVRINDGTNTREQFLPNPPQNCVGCHSVSNSGRYMAGRFGGGDNVGSVLDLTQDLTGSPPPLAFSLEKNTRWWFSSWSPDDSRLAVTFDEQGTRVMRMVNPVTGDYVEPASGTLPTNATHPAWAPDNSSIAYVGELDAWGGANTRGTLSLVPVTGPDAFGAPVPVLAGDAVPNPAPDGRAISYPTWTPDSAWLVFAHGSSSRSENGQAALYAVKRDGTGLVRLDRASGGAATSDTFQPRMSPFREGGYFWVTYLSRRDYGNAEVGTRGSGRQQIWVSAFKEQPSPGQDPSAVGYWLPGQATTSMNISAYWAPRACKGANLSCASGAECCSKDCRPDAQGVLTCSPESTTTCQPIGGACAGPDDCCASACVSGRCGGV